MKPTLAELAAAWRTAKEAEKAANTRRLNIEASMLEHFKPAIEGTETIGNVKVSFKLTRKVDAQALMQAWENNLSENSRKCFKWSADVDIKAMRSAQDMDADAYAAAAKFITTTPAKPYITVIDGK